MTTSPPGLGTPSTRRVFVFSHPNHELAIFGLARRLRPSFVFLTDGGGARRVAETRQALSSIGLEDRARFLPHTEQSFYDALLRRDVAFFETVAAEVRATIDALGAEQVYADAVELYNPVHDISLPIVAAALRGSRPTAVFEVPLMYQRPGDGERYEVQRFPPSDRGRSIDVTLDDDEVAAKEHARDRIYTTLLAQLGPVLRAIPRPHLAVEQIATADTRLPEPGERALRYEWRGELLRGRGEVSETITYAGHYAPIASALFAP